MIDADELQELEEALMAIVGAFDVHRRQVTFDVLDTGSGQVRRGQVRPACRATLRQFLDRFAGQSEVSFAVEGCTGWRFIVEELQRAGVKAHLADPAATADARGSKRRAKTHPTHTRQLRGQLGQGRPPPAGGPPGAGAGGRGQPPGGGVGVLGGPPRRFTSAAQAVRHPGRDVTVYPPDGKRSPGHRAGRGPPVLRWALYEAGCSAARSTSPDLDYYHDTK